jgi:hypothetical protein
MAEGARIDFLRGGNCIEVLSMTGKAQDAA